MTSGLSPALFVVIEHEVEHPLLALSVITRWAYANSLIMIGIPTVGLPADCWRRSPPAGRA